MKEVVVQRMNIIINIISLKKLPVKDLLHLDKSKETS